MRTPRLLSICFCLLLMLNSKGLFAQTWTSLESGSLNGNTALNATYLKLVRYNSTVYAIWAESTNLRVSRYDGGTSWSFVDDGGLFWNSAACFHPSAAVVDNYLYVAWCESDTEVGGTPRIHVKRYDGSSWTFVQSYTSGLLDDGRHYVNLMSSGYSYSPALGVHNGKLYISWIEQTNVTFNHQLHVSEFNGTNWTSIDGADQEAGLNFNYAGFYERTVIPITLASYNNSLYISWKEYSAVNGTYQFRVKRYDGGTSWTFVDGNTENGLNYRPTEEAESMSIIPHDGFLYALWNEATLFDDYYSKNYVDKVRVKRYDGSSWTYADGGTDYGWAKSQTYFSMAAAYHPAALSYNNTLYVGWNESDTVDWVEQVRMVTFDGTTKTFIDGDLATGLNVNTAQFAEEPALAECNGELYLGWLERTSRTGPFNVRVKKYALPAVVTSVAVPGNGSYKIGDVLTFTVKFNKTITVSGGTPFIPLTLNTPGTVNASYTSGSGSNTLVFSYTLSSGDFDNNGISLGTEINLAGSTLKDGSLLDARLSLNNVAGTSAIFVDAIAPSVTSITRNNPTLESVYASSVVYSVEFSEIVNQVDISDFSLSSSGDVAGTIASVSASSGSSILVTVNNITGGGTLQLNLKSSGTGITDNAGNPISGGYNTGESYTILKDPVLSILSCSNVTTTTARINCNMSHLGYPTTTQYGIVWGTSSTPTVALPTRTELGTPVLGDFISDISDLNPATTCYVRAYATTANGTFYSDEINFTTSPVLSDPGNAISFDGANDYISVPDNDEGISAFTIETWVLWQPDASNNIQFICAKGMEQMELHTGATANALRFIPATGVYIDALNVLPVGVWTHVAAVYDPSQSLAKLYINGSEVPVVKNGVNPVTTTVANTTSNFNIGRRNDGSYYFKGAIDEMKIWKRVRSQAEIKNDMTIPLNVSGQTGLIGYYNFNYGSSGESNTGITELTDQNGTFNGTLNNFALSGSTSNWVESYAMVVPTATTATDISSAGFTANWTAPAYGPVENYLLDVAEDYSFTTLVSGSPFTITSSGHSRIITDLSPRTTYYYRVRANKTSVAGQGCNSEIIELRTTRVINIWNGTGNWDETTYWSTASSPGSDDSTIVASGTLTLNQDAQVAGLTINSDAVLTIAPGQILTVTGTLINDADSAGLILQSNATGTGQLINGTSGVRASVQQFITEDQWHYLGIPFADSAKAVQHFKGLYVAECIEDSALHNSTRGWVYLDTTNYIVPGTGYGIYHDFDTTMTIYGTLNATEQTVPVTRRDADHGWNLISNPFPCAVDWDFVSGHSGLNNVNNAIYVYDAASESYASYVDGVTGGAGSQNQYIPPMQGFFVRSTAAGSVVFSEGAKSTGTTSFKSSNLDPLIRLTVTSPNGRSDNTVIRIAPQSTDNFDGPYDAYKLLSTGSATPQLYSLLKGEEYSVNSIPNLTEKTIIPIKILIRENGRHNIALTELSSYGYAFPVFLYNPATREFIQLEKGEYSFTAMAGEIIDLQLLFSNDLTGVESMELENIIVELIDNRLKICGLGAGKSNIRIYNISGQVLCKGTTAADSFTQDNLPAGVLLIRVEKESGRSAIRKVLVK